MTTRSVRDERGGSQSIMVLLLVASLMLVAGLIVDGGRKVTAAQRAEAAAGTAARAGQEAAATERLAGHNGAAAGVAAARDMLRRTPQVQGSVQLLAGGRLQVTTQSTESTVYLSAIGITSVTGRGQAIADLLTTGARR